MLIHSSRVAILVSLVALNTPLPTVAGEFNPVAHEPHVVQAAPSLAVIVKLRPSAATAAQKLATTADRSAGLAKRTGVAIQLKREISASMLATKLEPGDLDPMTALQRLRADPEVEYAVLDQHRYAQATTPNDPLFAGQWYLKATEVSAVNAINAWDHGQGSAGVVIAVLDTGVRYDHPDLGRAENAGKLLPGFDFVSGTAQANDGDGRDADPSDPGDWIDDTDKANAAFTSCDVSDSSWHGTRVSGMIGALTNNGAGVAALDWGSFILPVRVLGKCGGIDSDILAGMRWAAGLHVNGVTDNPYPARILNMSLGATGACEQSYLDVIRELTALKVLVVISAGNEGTMVSSPANCAGVAGIAAIRHAGSKVGFSNLGPEVAVAAPGGNCVNINGGPCLFSLDTTSNTGTKTPAASTFTDQNNSNLGTSFSAPIVSGIAGLMLSRNNNLSTAQLIARLREGARPFPTTVPDPPAAGIQNCHVPTSTSDIQVEQCLCTTDTCGAGMADASNSVIAAERPIAAVAAPMNVSPGQNVTLNASASAAACGATVASYAWTVVAPTTNPPAITGASTASVSLTAPVFSSVTLRLTVTDDQGRTDTADVEVDPNRAFSSAPAAAGTAACATAVTPPPPTGGSPPPAPAPTPAPTPTPKPPASSGGGGGGGGSLELLTLALLGAASVLRTRRTRRKLFSRCI